MWWLEWHGLCAVFVCFLLVSGAVAYLSARHASPLLPVCLALAYFILYLYACFALRVGYWRVDLWHGPDSHLVFALRLATMGACIGYTIRAAPGQLLWRALCAVVVSVSVCGLAWGVVPLHIESRTYELAERWFGEVPYEVLRLRWEIERQALTVLLSLGSVVGVLAGWRIAETVTRWRQTQGSG